MSARLIYGLGLDSDRPIPALAAMPATDRCDISVRFDEAIPARFNAAVVSVYRSFDDPADTEPCIEIERLEGGHLLRINYTDGTRFFLDTQAWSIHVGAPATMPFEDVLIYLLGPVLGVVLRLRDVVCLHASAISVDGQALVFIGDSGAGKSSLAAAFARAGHAVLGDDIVPLRSGPGAIAAVPAYARLRLWPDAAAGLFGSADALPLITPGWDKRYLDLERMPNAFAANPLPIGALYFLGDRLRSPDPGPRMEPFAARAAVMALVANTFANRFIDAPRRAREFALLAGLVRQAPAARQPQLCDDYAQLHDGCALLIRHFRAQRLHHVASCG